MKSFSRPPYPLGLEGWVMCGGQRWHHHHPPTPPTLLREGSFISAKQNKAHKEKRAREEKEVTEKLYRAAGNNATSSIFACGAWKRWEITFNFLFPKSRPLICSRKSKWPRHTIHEHDTAYATRHMTTWRTAHDTSHDTRQMTHDTWHATHDTCQTWHTTHDTWQWRKIWVELALVCPLKIL